MTITHQQKNDIIQQWLNNINYREISESTGVSTGAISGIIKEEEKRQPDLNEIRATLKLWKKHNISPKDIERYAHLLESLNILNLTIKNVEEATLLLAKYGEKAPEVLAEGIKLSQIESQQGRSYSNINKDLQTNINKLNNTKAELTKVHQQVIHEEIVLTHLNELEELQNKLNKHHLTHSQLNTIIEDKLQLEALGFTIDTAKILAEELRKINETPQKASQTLSTQLKTSESLLNNNYELQKDLDKNGAAVDLLEHQKIAIENMITHHKKSLDGYVSLIQQKENFTHKLETNVVDQERHLLNLRRELGSLNAQLAEIESLISKYEEKIYNGTMNVIIALLVNPNGYIENEVLHSALLKVVTGLKQQ